MDYALIGNCSYQALIDRNTDIAWLCWPRFDASFVFGSLVDADKGGEYSIRPAGGDSETSQSYLPNTNIVRTHVTCAGGSYEVIDFAPRFYQFERAYKPLMLVRRVRRTSGAPMIRITCAPRYMYGELEPASYTASNHIQWMIPGAKLRLTTNAPLSYVQEGRPFALDEDIYLCLTWGEPLEAPLTETCEALLGRTRRYWERWVKHCVLPQRYQTEVIRSALALKLHQYDDTGAITAATTTSIPEYPGSGRNWDYRYCWLRDAWFTLGALRRLGHFEEMERFVSYLRNIAEASPDRLQPVYGITGERELHEHELGHLAGYRGSGPVRAGNGAYSQIQHDVYGEMVAAIAPMFVDVRYRDRAAERSTRLLHSLLERIDTYLEAPDAGLWEKRQEPCLHTFSLLMHWAGATSAARVGDARGDVALSDWGTALAARARSIIEERAWRPDPGFFADSPDTSHADASLLMMINLGFLSSTDPRAHSHVDALADRLAASEHLLYRYRHDDGIGETHATFTVCGFWYAEALAHLGRAGQAERVFEALLGHANHVGLFSEDIDPDTGALWGNFPQTYSHVGIIHTAFALSPVVGTAF